MNLWMNQILALDNQQWDDMPLNKETKLKIQTLLNHFIWFDKKRNIETDDIFPKT